MTSATITSSATANLDLRQIVCQPLHWSMRERTSGRERDGRYRLTPVHHHAPSITSVVAVLAMMVAWLVLSPASSALEPPPPFLQTNPSALDAGVHGGSGTLTMTGRVGPVSIGTATRADIEAFAGAPDNDGWSEGLVELGYDCRPYYGTPVCQTTFFLDASNRLVQFSSASPNYHAFGTVTAGTPTRRAAQLAHAEALVGCLTDILRHHSHPNIWLTIEIEGASARLEGGKLHAIGGRVGWLFLSQRGLPPC